MATNQRISQKEIDAQLKKFIHGIYACETIEDFKNIQKEIASYIDEQSLTMEQMRVLTESGACEMMNMIAGH